MDFFVLILGTDANAYYMARCCYEEYKIKPHLIGQRRLAFTKFSNILTAPILHTMNTELEENYSFPTYIEEMKKKGHQNLLSRKLVLGALSLFDDEYPIAISFNNKEFYWLKDMQIDE